MVHVSEIRGLDLEAETMLSCLSRGFLRHFLTAVVMILLIGVQPLPSPQFSISFHLSPYEQTLRHWKVL